MTTYACEAGDCTVEADEMPEGWAFDDESGGHICPECARSMQEWWDSLTPEQQAKERERETAS